MKAVLIFSVLAVALSAGAQQNGGAMAGTTDIHTSQNSLDWAGTYEGVLPCADCPGIRIRLTLNRDGTYERMTQYLERPGAGETVRGTFEWNASGNAITLDAHGGGQQYSVAEGRLTSLSRDGGGNSAFNNVLTLVSPTGKKDTLAQTLERYRWTLESATDGQNRRIDRLSPREEHTIVLGFSGNRLNIQGPCNRIMGSYQINAEGQLLVNGRASTMMACEASLMSADAMLSTVLAKPLNIEIGGGTSPQLQLRSASGDTLTFAGQATPEALYGPATRIFLEVSPQEVACEHPPASHTRCLQVRDRHYDEQGLAVGQPGEWRPLSENIEGFTHTEGIRNVLRIKRFDRNPVPAGASPYLYVLDLIVESELVAR
jgi:heat shock protein HslJ